MYNFLGNRTPSLRIGKRAGDIIVALVAIAIRWIPFGAAAPIVRIVVGPAVLFSQKRVGANFVPSTICKFGTTTNTAAVSTLPLALRGDRRVLAIGKLLHSTHFDEVPRLYNVLNGEMSTLGSQAEVPEFVNPDDPLWQEIIREPPARFDEARFLSVCDGLALASAENCRECYQKHLPLMNCEQSPQHDGPGGTLARLSSLFDRSRMWLLA